MCWFYIRVLHFLFFHVVIKFFKKRQRISVFSERLYSKRCAIEIVFRLSV